MDWWDVLYIFILFSSVVLFHWFCRFISRVWRISKLDDKSVLITGCDSGFGKALAMQLSSKGMQIFAACLTEKGKQDFEGTKNVHPFVMDVTNDASVKQGYAFVSSKAPNGLWGIVNNAGVLRGGQFDCVHMSDWELQFNVNVFGVARVSQVFLPLVRKSKGRIVNISSVAGRFSMPGTTSYSASKFAVQGMSDALRRELKMWGLRVIIIEPGIMRTPLWDVPFDKEKMNSSLSRIPKETLDLYGEKFFEDGYRASKKMVDKLSNDPQMVVDVLEESLTTRFPLTRYSVGKDTYMWFFLAYAPTWLSDFLLTLDNTPVPIALQKGTKQN